MLGQITREDAILKLRVSDGTFDVAVILGFIILINYLNPGYGFQGVPIPHIDPIGWMKGKYTNKPMPQISYKSSKFKLEMAGITNKMCLDPEMSDKNRFVMSHEKLYNLIAETYPGYVQVNENCKITDWQTAKHIIYIMLME